MDAYYRKARRPTSSRSGLSNSLKRPLATVTPGKPASSTPSKDLVSTDETQLNFKTKDNNVSLTSIRSGPESPAKSPSPPPRPRTPTNARLARPKQPPPVKRKLLPDERRLKASKPVGRTPQDLFRSIRPLETDAKAVQEATPRITLESTPEDKNNNTNDQETESATTTTTSKSTTHLEDVAASFGLRRLQMPATPPSTPVKQQVKRLPEPQSSSSQCPESPSKIAAGPLRGVSSSLLDLIRAKEAKAKQVTPEQVRQSELLGIAPEIVRIVPNVFIANKMDIIRYDLVVEKCFKGLKSNYTTDTIIECLDLMKKVAPEWITVVEISRGSYMRLSKDKYTLPQLLAAIQRYKRDKGLGVVR